MPLAFILGLWKLLRRFEYKIDSLFDLVGQRLEGHHAILPNGRRDRSDDMQAAAAAGDIETGFKSRQIPQSCDFRNRGAHRRLRDEIEMLAGLGNVLKRHRNVPWRNGIWRFGLGHRNALRIRKNNGAAQQDRLIVGLKLTRYSVRVA